MDAFNLPQLLLVFSLVLPWLGFALLPLPRFQPWVRRSLPGLPIMCIALLVFAPGASLELPGLLLGSQFGIDALNRGFLLVTALAWLIASVLAQSFTRTSTRSLRFLSYFLLSMAGNFALVLSQDAVSFFSSFAVMSLAAYGLVNHSVDAASTRAGRVYMVLAICGELMLFAGLIAIAHGVADLRFPLVFDTALPDWAIACVVLGFGVKAGLILLHMSIPLAYAAAPLAGGVALAGAMLNAGLLGWLRWLPLGSDQLGTWGMVFVVCGLAGAACGVLIGLLQSAPRALLGYSSISQVGLMMLFIGTGMLAPGQWPAYLPLLGYFVVHHAIAKTALFCASSGRIPTAGPRWIWWGVLTLPALALIGVPFSSGYIAKAGLKAAVALPQLDFAMLGACLTLATIGTSALMVRYFYLLMHSKPDPDTAAPWMALGLSVLVAASPWIMPPALVMPATQADDLFATVWPVLLAIVAAGALWYYRPRFACALVGLIPNGDIAGVLTTGLALLLGVTRRLGLLLGRAWSAACKLVEFCSSGVLKRLLPD